MQSFLSVLLFLIFFSGTGSKGPGAHAKPGAARVPGGYGGGGSNGGTGSSDAGGSTGTDNGSGAGTNGGGSTAAQPPKVYTYKVVKDFPHDPEAFTQGLQYDRLCQDKQGGKQECRCGGDGGDGNSGACLGDFHVSQQISGMHGSAWAGTSGPPASPSRALNLHANPAAMQRNAHTPPAASPCRHPRCLPACPQGCVLGVHRHERKVHGAGGGP